MTSRWRRTAGWLLMGFVTGLIAGALGSILNDAPPLGQLTWTLALVSAVAFGVAEFVRAGRRPSQ